MRSPDWLSSLWLGVLPIQLELKKIVKLLKHLSNFVKIQIIFNLFQYFCSHVWLFALSYSIQRTIKTKLTSITPVENRGELLPTCAGWMWRTAQRDGESYQSFQDLLLFPTCKLICNPFARSSTIILINVQLVYWYPQIKFNWKYFCPTVTARLIEAPVQQISFANLSFCTNLRRYKIRDWVN